MLLSRDAKLWGEQSGCAEMKMLAACGGPETNVR
jgi:hypothetical protein